MKKMTIFLFCLAMATMPLLNAWGADEKPQYGGNLKMIASRATKALGAPFEGDVWYALYGLPAVETLMVRDGKGNFLPNLATSWDIAPDGKLITFKLREGVTFHDGTELTSEAVKANFEKIKRGILKRRLKSVEIIDKHTFKLHLKQWDASLFLDMTLAAGMIGSPTAFSKPSTPENQAKDHMVGTGPYQFVSWERDNYIKFKRYDGYWGGKPYLDSLEFSFIKDPMTAVMAFQSGAAQLIMRITPKDAKELKAKGYEILSMPYGLKNLVPDGDNPDSPFSNLKVRKALGYAIDRKAITDAIGLGFWEPVFQASNDKKCQGYLTDIEEYSYDPAKAKRLLSEAGYPNGFKTKIIAKAEENHDLMVALQAYLADVGIKVKLELVDRGRYIALHKDGWKNGLMYTTIGVFRSPAAYSIRAFAGVMLYNKSAYHPPGFAEQFDKIMATVDSKEQHVLTQKLFRTVHEQAMLTPLWVETQLAAQTDKVHDTGWCDIFFSLFTPEKAWLSK